MGTNRHLNRGTNVLFLILLQWLNAFWKSRRVRLTIMYVVHKLENNNNYFSWIWTPKELVNVTRWLIVLWILNQKNIYCTLDHWTSLLLSSIHHDPTGRICMYICTLSNFWGLISNHPMNIPPVIFMNWITCELEFRVLDDYWFVPVIFLFLFLFLFWNSAKKKKKKDFVELAVNIY